MKVFEFTQTSLAPVVLYQARGHAAFVPIPKITGKKTTVFAKEILNDMDMMCISNAANLCSQLDQCNGEEREAFMNRFEQQSDILATQLATVQTHLQHLKRGDHSDLFNEDDITELKGKILTFLDESSPGNFERSIEYLKGMEVEKLQEDIDGQIFQTEHDVISKAHDEFNPFF
ncbi:hypothetical protein CTEN210_03377 [Chaetoceros tenuissimus]|uniref:Uncharacterized protein n=1 Tax=Chaetoceros tenuissimus TaxID=426638 RepID=A0AAD3CJT0_9STRA|nr:hypothetical protein CTEN210_03377 [Chaetoceros tenuissimus]